MNPEQKNTRKALVGRPFAIHPTDIDEFPRCPVCKIGQLQDSAMNPKEMVCASCRRPFTKKFVPTENRHICQEFFFIQAIM